MAVDLLTGISKDEKAREYYLARQKVLLDQKSAKKYQEIKLKEVKEDTLKFMILKIIKHKFNNVPNEYTTIINNLDIKSLEDLSDKVLLINDLDEFKKYFKVIF